MYPDPQNPPASAICTDKIATSCNVQEENAMFAQEIRGKEGGEGDVPGFRGQQPVAIGHFSALPFLSPSALTASLSLENEKRTDRVTDHVSSPDDIQEVRILKGRGRRDGRTD